MHLPEKFNNTALSCSGSYYGLNQKQSSPLSWHMPPKKKKANQSRPVASSSSASDATTGSSISSDARAPALESSPQSMPSALDPSAILRSLLSSEASAAARSLVARAYMQCLLASSVPDELRTPAFIVLLGAECPASRVDRLCTFSLLAQHHSSFLLLVHPCLGIYNFCACRRLPVPRLPSTSMYREHSRAMNRSPAE